MSTRRGNRGLYLSECHDLGQLVAVRCNYCTGPWRLYEPSDLQKLLGNVELDRLRGRLRCEGCDRREYTDVAHRWRDAAFRDGATVRRLVRIQTIRRPVWRDERL